MQPGREPVWALPISRSCRILAALWVFVLLLPMVSAEAAVTTSSITDWAGDRVTGSARPGAAYDVRGSGDRRTGSWSPTTSSAGFAFTFASPAHPWTTDELEQLRSWTAVGSPQLNALAHVVGAPEAGATINVSHDPTIASAGFYYPGADQIVLRDLRMSVLLHELNHAVHGSWVISNSVWEEGMARAAEMREMGLLAADGIVEDQYSLHHSYPYNTYYENSNRAVIGVRDGSIWDLGEPALRLLRYEQAGYAFGKVLIENPDAFRKFNSELFRQPSGSLSPSGLRTLLSRAQPFVEGVPTARWARRQRVLRATSAEGCVLLQRPSQFSVDFLCRDAAGVETPQAGATVRLDVYDSNNRMIFTGQDVTTALGWVSFGPPTTGSYRRLRLVASVVSGPSAPTSTYFRSDTPGDDSTLGVFGVVRNRESGTVTLTSPDGQFESVTVPVTDGGFHVQSLRSLRGPVEATFSGGGLTATRRFNKDASPYSVVMRATTPRCGSPGPTTHGLSGVALSTRAGAAARCASPSSTSGRAS